MKTIIAGSRTARRYQDLLDAMEAAELVGITSTVVISGTAAGGDRLGERYAREKGLPLWRYPANWEQHGKRAGYLRNESMGDSGEGLIALWDGVSRGTRHMIDIAQRKGLIIVVWPVNRTGR